MACVVTRVHINGLIYFWFFSMLTRQFVTTRTEKKTVVLVAEMVWSSFSIVWLHGSYITCPAGVEKEILLGKNTFNHAASKYNSYSKNMEL